MFSQVFRYLNFFEGYYLFCHIFNPDKKGEEGNDFFLVEKPALPYWPQQFLCSPPTEIELILFFQETSFLSILNIHVEKWKSYIQCHNRCINCFRNCGLVFSLVWCFFFSLSLWGFYSCKHNVSKNNILSNTINKRELFTMDEWEQSLLMQWQK